jgi:uncharacterized protein YhbP (UPF0306 family)
MLATHVSRNRGMATAAIGPPSGGGTGMGYRREVTEDRHAELARRLIDENAYMTLGTADAARRPWASPVFYAADADTTFLWVSSPDAQHSRNIAERADAGVVIFDSRVAVGAAQAFYARGRAEQVPDGDIDAAIEIYSRVSRARGAGAWSRRDVCAPARLHLYRLTASARWVLDARDDAPPGDQRVPVVL